MQTLSLQSIRICSQKFILKLKKLNLQLNLWSTIFFHFQILVSLCSKLPLSTVPNSPILFQFTPPWLCSLFYILPKNLCTLHEKTFVHWKQEKLLFHNRTGWGKYNLGETHGLQYKLLVFQISRPYGIYFYGLLKEYFSWFWNKLSDN